MAKKANNRRRQRPEVETVSDKPLVLPFLVAQLIQRGDGVGPTEAALLEIGVAVFNGALKLDEAVWTEADIEKSLRTVRIATACSRLASLVFKHLKL